MAPRAYWKGYLRLSLVSCPIALFPATSEREKVSFHQINRATGNRIRYRKVDAETGEEVPSDQIIKGYEVAKGEYVEISDEEIREALMEPVRQIVESVRIALERTPPELASDIVGKGIVLAGGGALLRNLDVLLREETGLPVSIAADPLTAVVMGAGKVLDQLSLLRDVAVD